MSQNFPCAYCAKILKILYQIVHNVFLLHATIFRELLSCIIRINIYFFHILNIIFQIIISYILYVIKLHVYCVSLVALNILKAILKYAT